MKIEPGDVNTTPGNGNTSCKRNTGGHGPPVEKFVVSCGCTVLLCAECMVDRWKLRGIERDIYWWLEAYGKSHDPGFKKPDGTWHTECVTTKRKRRR